MQTFFTRTAFISKANVDCIYADYAAWLAEHGGHGPDAELPSFESDSGFGAPEPTKHRVVRHIAEAYSASNIVAGSYVTLVVSMHACTRACTRAAVRGGSRRTCVS